LSTPLSPLPIRLFCDLAAPSNLFDLIRSQPPAFYRGDDIEIDIGIGQNGSLLAPTLASSGAGGIASVSCQVFESENDTDSPMMSCTVLAANMNLVLTQANWNAGGSANSHAQFIFPNSQTAISLGGAASVNYWFRIIAQTTDSPAKMNTLLDGPITVKDGPISTASAPPLAAWRTFTVGGVPVLQLLDTSTGLYYTLSVVSDAGVETLQVSDQGYYGAPPPAPPAAAWRMSVVGGVSVLQLLDSGTGLYHTLSCINNAGVETLQISDQGY